MKAVAAPDIEDARVGGEAATPAKNPTGLQSLPNAIDESELGGRKVECVIVGRVDPR
jgi:hypothetical protein